MIVYVESSFVLELAFLRTEHEACTTLLDSAESHELRLALPAFSVGETYEALVRRSKRRGELHNQL
jgi:predicted nucleic acid-binding protein